MAALPLSHEATNMFPVLVANPNPDVTAATSASASTSAMANLQASHQVKSVLCGGTVLSVLLMNYCHYNPLLLQTVPI